MAAHGITFEYVTGLTRRIFRNARLRGSWDASGRHSDEWSEIPMTEAIGDDGCPIFTTRVKFDTTVRQQTFRWGVVLDGPQGSNFWGIATEVRDVNSVARYREFLMRPRTRQIERYYLTWGRRLGANKHWPPRKAAPVLRFAVWAPNARAVDVVFAEPDHGYVANDGTGIDAARPIVTLARTGSGIWEGQAPTTFDAFMSAPYMYRIVNAQGETVFRSDIFSRSQIGKGTADPAAGAWDGTADSLDGRVSCSVVIDPDVVRRGFQSTRAGVRPDLIPAAEFWATEFTPGLPVPSRLADLVIYELHVGSLGFGTTAPGGLGDAIALLDYLVALGVNAVELLPLAEFSGVVGWGYGDTHHLCIESSAGGRDKYRHFVRECHRRGIAVIQDVVYNHYDSSAERAEWQYDSNLPEDNIYYWYEGRSSEYPSADGGYLDNGSTDRTPRFWEEAVRQQFISSAAFLLEEMHVDGLRVDLTQAIHRDNRLHADGRSIGSANIFGQKLLREWSRTLHMIRPSAMLIAEDHTGWDAVTMVPAQGGLGFDATWDVAFYHSLIGDSESAGGHARLLKLAGTGSADALAVDAFGGALYRTRDNRVVFHESHDEAGNAAGTARTMVVAVNGAPLFADTRTWAEARSRVCCGLSLLSAGTPMFFMGEEIGAQRRYTYDNFLASRENLIEERDGGGRHLFRFYQDLITLRRRLRALRTQNIDILHCSNANRVIAFKRWAAGEEILVAASLNNDPFPSGYIVEKDRLGIPDGGWKEIFNSDSSNYGGRNIGNGGAIVNASGGRIQLVLPAVGFVVFARQ